MRSGFEASRKRAALVLLAPFLALFAWVYVLPMFYALYQSLFQLKRSGLGLEAPERVFAGLDNYVRVLGDAEVISGVGRVLLFGLVQVPIMLGLALFLALLLDSTVARGKTFFRLTFFLPYAIPGVIAAILWSFLYMPSFSPLRALFGIDFLSPGNVLWSTANIVTWSWTGYNMIVIFTALQAVPRELYEAARMDGASAWRINLSIKVPMVRPAIILTALFSIIGTLQLFNEPSVMRVIAPGGVSSTYTPAMAAYAAAFSANDYNYAAAIAVLLALTTCVLSLIFHKLTERSAG